MVSMDDIFCSNWYFGVFFPYKTAGYEQTTPNYQVSFDDEINLMAFYNDMNKSLLYKTVSEVSRPKSEGA